MDPIEIGSRIREIRRSKDKKLRDFQNLFSMGKLSNIEKGKIPVNIDDIKLICEQLGVPLNAVLDDGKDRLIESLSSDIQRARALMVMGIGDSAEKLLLSVSKEIKKHDIKYLKAEVSYYWGIYHYQTSLRYKVAEAYFKRVISDDAKHQHVATFKLKALNALSCLYNDLGKLGAALKIINEAHVFLTNNPVDKHADEVNVLFNKAILNIHLGDYQTATLYANNALATARGSIRYKIVYLIAIIQILCQDYETAAANLNLAMDFFLNEKDIPGIMKAFQAQYFLYTKDYDKYRIELELTERSLLKHLLKRADQESAPSILDGVHLITVHNISIGNYQIAEKLIEECKRLIPLIPNEKVHFKTFYLESRLVRKTTDDKELIKDLLLKALTYLEEDESQEKASILFELAELTGEPGGLFRQSSQIYYNLYSRELYDLSLIKYAIPKPSL